MFYNHPVHERLPKCVWVLLHKRGDARDMRETTDGLREGRLAADKQYIKRQVVIEHALFRQNGTVAILLLGGDVASS